jgi:hypothetical protein
MTDLSFSQAERRNPTLTILIAFAVLAIIAALIFYLNPHDTAALAVSNTSVVPTRTTFKSNTTEVNATPATEDDLYILTTLKVDDHLRLPITIDTVNLTLLTADGQQTSTGAATASDLPAIFTAFPQLKPLQAPPLLRETEIQPGQSAQGQLIFQFPITKDIWDKRKSATITLSLYHQTPQTIKIP